MLSSWQIGYSQEISKSERKELIAKSKQFKKDPAQLKALLGQTEVMKVRASKAEQELEKSKDEIALLQSNLSEIQQENQNLKATLGEERMALSKLPASATKGYVLPIEGVVFRVQIGGYRKRDLSSYIDNSQENIR